MPFLDVRRKSLYYRLASAQRQRDAVGPVFLFIHGLGSSSSFYAPIIPSLAAAGYECVAFDTHGRGSDSTFSQT
jgi:pimeloyl-ACP methyl ester carboxylesterase